MPVASISPQAASAHCGSAVQNRRYATVNPGGSGLGGRFHSATHDSAISRINSAARYSNELREHLDQILKGPAFKGTQRSQAFLRHVVERSLAGDFESLRERSIGMVLFSRPADYDTGEDAVVRVAASDVRKRLLQHYAGAGADSSFRIEIPAGSYLPEFHILTDPETSLESPPAVAPAPPLDPPATVELPLKTEAATVPPPVMPRARGIALAAIFLIAGAALGLLVGRGLPRKPAAADDLVGEIFAGTPASLQVIISDEGLVLAQVLMRRMCTLQEYEDFTCFNAPELQQESLKRLTAELSKREIGNIGDIQNSIRLHDRLRARNWEVIIRHARQVHARDFRSGNFIILGGSFGNPWAGFFPVPNSSFPLEEPRPQGRVAAYLNPHPRPGEPSSFPVSTSADGSRTTTHARITLVDNMSHTGRVLLVAGQSVSATELAADFLFHPDSGVRTAGMLGLPAGGPLPNLEMILRVTEANQVGENVELVACRRLANRAD